MGVVTFDDPPPTSGVVTFDEEPPKPQAELKADNTATRRQRMAQDLRQRLGIGDEMVGRSPLREKLIGALVGSQGSTNEEGPTQFNLADFTPVLSNMLNKEEMDRAANRGDVLGTVGGALGAAMPIPGARNVMTTAGNLTNMGARAALEATPRQRLLRAAERQGVDLNRAVADVTETGNPGRLGRMAGSIADQAVVGEDLARSAQDTARQTQAAAERVMAGYGRVGPDEAGQNVTNELQNWIKNGARHEMGPEYEDIEMSMRPHPDLDPFHHPHLQSPMPATRQLRSQVEREMAESHNEMERAALQSVEGALQQDTMTYTGMKNLRTKIQNLMDPLNPQAGTLAPVYGRLRNAITEDMGNMIRTRGGEELYGRWQAANARMTEINNQRDMLRDLISGGPNSIPGETVVDRIIRKANAGKGGDLRALELVTNTLSDGAREQLAGEAFHRLGLQTTGNNMVGEWNPATFSRNYRKLSEDGQNLLFGQNPVQRVAAGGYLQHSLDDLALIGEHWDRVQRMGNPSGSGRHMTVAGIFAVGAGAIVNPVAALPFAAGLAGEYGFARVMAQPAVARAIHDYTELGLAAARYRSTPGNPSLRGELGVDQRHMAAFAKAGEDLVATIAQAAGVDPQKALQDLAAQAKPGEAQPGNAYPGRMGGYSALRDAMMGAQ